jgi:hypothetical protein
MPDSQTAVLFARGLSGALGSMIVRLLGLAVSLVPLLANAGECVTSALEEGRAKWSAAEIRSYRFTLWEYRGGWSPRQSPVRVTVSKGAVVSTRYLHYAFRPGAELEFDITELDTADVLGRDTVPKLFDLIQKHLQQADIVRRCTFHPKLGFPMQYGHYSTVSSHGGYSFSISDFEVLE